MRTLIDIPEQDLAALNRMSKAENVSRAELVRRAITLYLSPQKRDNSGLRKAFGAWKDNPEDGYLTQF